MVSRIHNRPVGTAGQSRRYCPLFLANKSTKTHSQQKCQNQIFVHNVQRQDSNEVCAIAPYFEEFIMHADKAQ